jgi:hypothetical protein
MLEGQTENQTVMYVIVEGSKTVVRGNAPVSGCHFLMKSAHFPRQARDKRKRTLTQWVVSTGA